MKYRNSHDFCNVQEPGALRCAYDGLIADRGKVCNLIRFVARHPLSTSNCHCVARRVNSVNILFPPHSRLLSANAVVVVFSQLRLLFGCQEKVLHNVDCRCLTFFQVNVRR